MSAIREQGKINGNTTLIDLGMQGSYGLTAVYLIQADRTCLIDGGTRLEAPRMIKALRRLGAFPPDLIIATHPHWDHVQGIPLLRQEASREGKRIEVVAARDAIPLLEDASFNDVFGRGPYENILSATSVKEGDTIDLGSTALQVYEIPGHCTGHLSLLEKKNGNIFVGDALGIKVQDDIFLPPFMPPFWNLDAFLSSVDKLKQIPYETLCLAHFGCIRGGEARSILDEAVKNCEMWWQFYEKHADRLDDTAYLLEAMRKEIHFGVPALRPVSWLLKVMLGLMTAVGSVAGKRTAIIDRLAFADAVRWLGMGYESARQAAG